MYTLFCGLGRFHLISNSQAQQALFTKQLKGWHRISADSLTARPGIWSCPVALFVLRFPTFLWSECLTLQILEKWFLTLFLLMLPALFLSWRQVLFPIFNWSFLDLLNCFLQRLRSLITSRNSGFLNWNWSRCLRLKDLTGAWSCRAATNNFSQAQYTSSGSSKM